MDQFNGRTAVITGAGSGIGRALATTCARIGMHLVLADVDSQGLAETARLVKTNKCVLVPTDVSNADAVEALAERAYAEFGEVGLLFNNAGVATGGWIWESSPQDWAWLIGVNLMGVVHGIQAFVPRMMKQGQTAHVINTASAAGLISVPAASAYCASKHAVVTVSECLRHELSIKKVPIYASVLCPSFVQTGIVDSERHRPTELRSPGKVHVPRDENLQKGMQTAVMGADEVADFTLKAVANRTFYILPHENILSSIRERFSAITSGTGPIPGRLS